MNGTPDAAFVVRRLLEASEAGGWGACLTLVGDATDGAGSRLLLTRGGDGTTEVVGSLGSGGLDRAGRQVLEAALDDPDAVDGLVPLSGGEGERESIEAYLEIRRPVRDLVVVGAGHIARPLCHLGALLGFRVVVMDDRPAFATRERFPDAHRVVAADFSDPFADVALHAGSHVVLVTRGHKYDYECLVRVLGMERGPAYVGMIGSRRRVRATYVRLLDEGFSREALGRIRAPVGLDLGAETPEEIAVAVAAELVLLHRGGTGAPLRDVEDVARRFFPRTEDAPR